MLLINHEYMQTQNDSTVLDYRLSTIEDQLEGLKSDMQDMNAKQTQIIEALLGNPLVQSKGLSADFKDVKRKVYEHEKIIDKVKWSWWWIMAIGSVIAIIIQIIVKVFS